MHGQSAAVGEGGSLDLDYSEAGIQDYPDSGDWEAMVGVVVEAAAAVVADTEVLRCCRDRRVVVD